MNRVFIVIPAYNEQQTLSEVIDGIRVAGEYVLVIVDDGSDPPLNSFIQQHGCHIIRHAVNLGQGAALQTGISYSLQKGADIIVSFDADGQHDPRDIKPLVSAVLEGKADVVMGSRFAGEAPQMPFTRKVLIHFARIFHYMLTGLWMSDAHNGIRALSRKAASKIQLKENRMAHATELILEIKRHSLKWMELPVTVHYSAYSRKKGQSSANSIRILFDVVLHKLFR